MVAYMEGKEMMFKHATSWIRLMVWFVWRKIIVYSLSHLGWEGGDVCYVIGEMCIKRGTKCLKHEEGWTDVCIWGRRT